jgi:hypothetical protein
MAKKPRADHAARDRGSAKELQRDETLFKIKQLEYEIFTTCNLITCEVAKARILNLFYLKTKHFLLNCS